MYVRVVSPNADSIELQSADGSDRYSSTGPVLQLRLPANFGMVSSRSRYAVRAHGRLLNVLKNPVNVVVCRRRACQSYYHELSLLLPEQNRRRFAVTAGWGTSFGMRSFGRYRRLIAQESANRSEWDLQAELSVPSLNARLGAYGGPEFRSAALDISHELKRREDGLGYGAAIHLAVTDRPWPRTIAGDAIGSGLHYRASIGPAIMLKGITASSQLGIYSNGNEILEELSTYFSINGGLTEVRLPLTITLERTIAVGDWSSFARRREELQRVTIAWEVVPSLALRMKIATATSAWPNHQSGHDLRAQESALSLGAQYSFGW